MNESRVNWLIYNNPIELLEIKSPSLLSTIDNFLPYSVGTEIETTQPPDYDHKCFTSIPDIMEIKSSCDEQRYRIPSGLKGLVCMFRLCQVCNEQLEINSLSGIHHHIDFTDCYDLMCQKKSNILQDNRDWILNELDSWDYHGTSNQRPNWVRWNGLKTLEFRCADMTFDYDVMIKRVIHACAISKILKMQLGLHSKEEELSKLQEQLKEVNSKMPKPSPVTNLESASSNIKSRIIRI